MLRIPEFENHFSLSHLAFGGEYSTDSDSPQSSKIGRDDSAINFFEFYFGEIALGVAFIYSAKGRRLSVSAIILSLWLFALFCESVVKHVANRWSLSPLRPAKH